jgi:hypothetical protein
MTALPSCRTASTRTLVCLALVVVPACHPGYYSVNPDGSRTDRYSRINEYTSYEPNGLGQQEHVAKAYGEAQHAPPPKLDVEILNATLPPGVTIDGRTLKISDTAPYDGVGTFEIGYWRSSAPVETEIGDDMKRLAAITHADIVVVEVTRKDHADPHVDHVNGVLLRKHPRATGAPVPQTAAPPPARTGATPHAVARLRYRAADGCLTPGELADEISARLGYSPWSDDAPAELSIEVASAGEAFTARVRLASGETKQLTGASCKALTDAVIAAVVVLLDPAPRPAP